MAHVLFRNPLPTIESGKRYAPGALALEILNLQRTPDGTLRAVRGPCPLIPDYGAGFPAAYSRMFGVFHVALDSGMRDVTLIRSGSKLLQARGWRRDVETLVGGGGTFSTHVLSDDGNPRFPDMFCEVGGRAIWTNGIDKAQIYDGYKLLPLGYSVQPNAPTALGPSDENAGFSNLADGTADTSASIDSEQNPGVYRNSAHYSHPGRIGSAGDILEGQGGAVLAGAWYYVAQFRDDFGNLSPLSVFGGPCTIRTEQTASDYNKDFLLWNTLKPLQQYAVHIDDLTKQFFVQGIPTGTDGTVARRVGRTPDTMRNPTRPHLLVEIPDNVTTVYPDNHADSELGAPLVDYAPVPIFKIMCPYGGGLAIANTSANPGMVMLSEPGLAGTFRKDRWLFPDPNGAEVTGLAPFEGMLLAFTINTVYVIIDDAEGLRAKPLTSNIGCVAPRSIKATGFGPLVWLGRDGFYAMLNGQVRPVSNDEENPARNIDTTIQKLNQSRLSLAVAEWSPETREYLCAVSEAGVLGNNMLLAFDGEGWRRQRLGLYITDMCLTKDARQYVIACGSRSSNGSHGVWVLDRETRNWTPPTKTYRYKSHWLRLDPLGLNRFNISTVYVGLVESVADAKLTWRTYANGHRDAVKQTGTLTLVAPDLTEHLSNIVLGTGKAREPRLYWKQFAVKLTAVDSFAFDLEGVETQNQHLHIAAFAFDATPVDESGSRASKG